MNPLADFKIKINLYKCPLQHTSKRTYEIVRNSANNQTTPHTELGP